MAAATDPIAAPLAGRMARHHDEVAELLIRDRVDERAADALGQFRRFVQVFKGRCQMNEAIGGEYFVQLPLEARWLNVVERGAQAIDALFVGDVNAFDHGDFRHSLAERDNLC